MADSPSSSDRVERKPIEIACPIKTPPISGPVTESQFESIESNRGLVVLQSDGTIGGVLLSDPNPSLSACAFPPEMVEPASLLLLYKLIVAIHVAIVQPLLRRTEFMFIFGLV